MIRRLISIAAFGGFGASAAINAATFFGITLHKKPPWLSPLHLGAIAFFIILFMTSRREKLSVGRSERWKRNLIYWRKFFGPMPKWIIVLVVACFIYAAVNFASTFHQLRSRIPETRIGSVPLREEPTSAEKEIHFTRMASSYWMLFYLLPAVYFWWPRPVGENSQSNDGLNQLI